MTIPSDQGEFQPQGAGTIRLLDDLASAPDLPTIFEHLCNSVGGLVRASGGISLFSFTGNTRLTLFRECSGNGQALFNHRPPDGDIGAYVYLNDGYTGRHYLLALRRRQEEGPFTAEEQATLSCISRVVSRIITMRSQTDSVPLEQLCRREVRGGSALLSRREAEVADCVCRGLMNAEAAHLLGISVRTVERHLRHVYRKLRVSGREDLIMSLRGDWAEPTRAASPGEDADLGLKQ